MAALMQEYGCPRCGSPSEMDDFEARPVFNDGRVETLELIVESWCDGCEAASLFTDNVAVDVFIEKLKRMD